MTSRSPFYLNYSVFPRFCDSVNTKIYWCI